LVDAINVHTQRIESALKYNGNTVSTVKIKDCDSETNLGEYKICLISPLRKIPPGVYRNLPTKIFYASMAYEVLYEILEKGMVPDSDFQNQISRATGIIVDSVAVKEAISQIFKFNGNYLQIPYGVDSALFTDIKIKNNEKIHIAALRNWSEVHRQSELMPFVTEILEDEKNVIIHIAGSGPKKPEALKKIKKFLKSGQIIDHGNVSNEEVLDILRASHIFLSNSRIDGSSVSVLEAMAVGTLVITTNTLGNRYWINSDVNGFLFNESPTRHTLKAIDLIKNRHEDYLKMIENAQSKAFKNANWDINSESMCIFIEQNNNEQ